MKKIFSLLIALLMVFSLSAFAGGNQKATPSQNVETLPGDPMSKSVNIRVYLPDLFAGYLGGVWDIALSPVMTFGPIVKVFAFGKYSGYAFGLNVNYSLSGDLFQNGWIINPYAEYAKTNYHQPFNSSGEREKVDTGIFGTNIMYEWIWKSGLNIMAGVGLEYSNEDVPITMNSDSDVHPSFEVTIGYAF